QKQNVVPNESLIRPPQAADVRVGFVNFWRDVDAVVRHVEFHEPAGELIYDSFAARALKKLRVADAVPGDFEAHAIRFGPEEAYQPRALYEICLPKTWHANYQD